MLFGLIAVVLFGIVLLLLKLKSPSFMMRSFLVALFGFLAIAPMQTVGATTVFKISNTALNGYANSPVLVRTANGSGSGAVSFTVTGAHCTVRSSGVLLATASTTCSVKATKAGMGSAPAVTSSIVRFVFRSPSTSLHISNTSLSGQVNATFQVTSGGASGSGEISFDTTGGTCAINPSTGQLISYSRGSCPVTVSQAASGSHRASTSPVVVFYFDVGPQDPLSVGVAEALVLPSETGIVYATGGSGSGAVTYALDTSQSNGSQCSLNTSTGQVSDTGHVNQVNCWVTATKGSSTGFLATSAASSVQVTFTTLAAGGSGLATHATPDEAFLTGITSGGTSLTSVDDTAQGLTWFINQYFSHPDHWLKYYITGGSTVVLTWHVQDFNGNALPNARVTLISNLPYTCSHGVTWAETTLNPAQSNCNSAAPFGSLTGTTDGSGNISFTLHNTNSASTQTTGDMTITGSRTAENTDKWSRFILKIGKEIPTSNPGSLVNQATDIIDIIMLP